MSRYCTTPACSIDCQDLHYCILQAQPLASCKTWKPLQEEREPFEQHFLIRKPHKSRKILNYYLRSVAGDAPTGQHSPTFVVAQDTIWASSGHYLISLLPYGIVDVIVTMCPAYASGSSIGSALSIVTRYF